jgi:outer membrane protein
MKNLRYLIIIFIIATFNTQKVQADNSYYLDFKYILNQSSAGKTAQDFLKKKLENGIKGLQNKEKKIQEDEKKLIQQKKIITPEEYKKKVTELRSKVSLLQKERNTLLSSVSKQRSKAKKELLKSLNPIVKTYMNEKGIRVVIDKKNILLADDKLDITKDIMILLNNKLKTISLK